jgi:hypothetical protein
LRRKECVFISPLGYYKDWNDALLGKKTMSLSDVIADYDYHVETGDIEEETSEKRNTEGSVVKRLAEEISRDWKSATGGEAELIEPREMPKGIHR